MKKLIECIERLQAQLERHRRSGLKEYPTRTILIDPMLEALGWDVRDPESVELEYPTVDGKSVDYALKVNRKAILLLEAKQLNDALDDLKAVTQVVGYAANNGIEWCVLTNGIRYKVYKSTELAAAPDKLLFEVSIDPRDSQSQPVGQAALMLARLSRDSLASGILDGLGEEIFTTAKVRKALDHLMTDPSGAIVRAIRKVLSDERLTPAQIQSALKRIWRGRTAEDPSESKKGSEGLPGTPAPGPQRRGKYSEDHHIGGKPKEIVELYSALDRFCQDLAPGEITRRYLAKYVTWSYGKWTFCCAHIQQSGMRVWVKVKPNEIPATATFARDVSAIGHWGVGDVELAIDRSERLREAEQFIRSSFEAGLAR